MSAAAEGNLKTPTGRAGGQEERAGYGTAGYGLFQLALILTAIFMVVLDFSIVNVALASIERELDFDASSVQWVVTGYAITFGGLLVLGGRAADLFGRRRLFRSGMLLFTVASLAGGLAQDPVLLVAARLFQGAGAAMVAPAALSLITTGFAEGQPRAACPGCLRGDGVARLRSRAGARWLSGPAHQLAGRVPGQRPRRRGSDLTRPPPAQ